MKLRLNRKVQCEAALNPTQVNGEPKNCRNHDCSYYNEYSSDEIDRKINCTFHNERKEFKQVEVKTRRDLTFKERFAENHRRDTNWCTLWDLFRTFMEFYGQVLGYMFSNGFGAIIGLIYDGYWLIFLSPFVLAYWILLLSITTIFALIWLILWLLTIPIIAWSLLLELPASLLNKKEIKYWKGENN